MKNKKIIIGGVSAKEQMILVKQLHAAIRSGYNSAQALEIAYSQSKNRLKQILEEVRKDVRNGAYLYEAFGKHKKYFPPLFIGLIKTGELSASLKENLLRLSTIIEKELSLKQKFRAAAAYPLFILVAVVALGLSIAVFVLPNLLPLFGSLDVELPLSTRILLWLAALFDAYGLPLFFGGIGLLITLIGLAKSDFARPVTHWVLLKLPLFGSLARRVLMARLARSLSSLLKSGVPIDESLKITATVINNYYYQQVIQVALKQIKKGQTLSGALEAYPHLFDEIFIKLLSLGELTAGLEEACDNAADYYDAEVDETVKNLAISLEPMLIIIVGGVVGLVAMSILGPIYKITGSIR